MLSLLALATGFSTTTKSIVDLAVATPDLSTLVAALKAGDLVSTLSGSGPFTVFAPTNEAFAKLPKETLDALLLPENKAALDDLLTYHVVSGSIHVKDLKCYQDVKTVEGKDVRVVKEEGHSGTHVFVNHADVTTADVDASNGVVHIIDQVLIPPGFTPPAPKPPAPTTKTIVDLAVATPDLSTLVAALKAGDLVSTLAGAGPFTVFAPSNEAFARLPKETLDALLLPENKAALADLLTYHVLPESVPSKDLKRFQDVKTVEGKDVQIIDYYGKVFVNHARVTTADVLASNGVVHIIDQVLIPPGFKPPTPTPPAPTTKTIVDLAVATPDLSTLVAALKAGALVSTLAGAGPFTVFAPTNEAFEKLPKATLAALLKPENKAALDDLLTYHVVSGSIHVADLKCHQDVKTVEGKDVQIIDYHGKVFVNHAEVTTADVDASNGVVHIINQVLLPPGFEPPSASA